MKLDEIRKLILKKYKSGQVVNMRVRNAATGEIMRRFKATVIKFYTYHVCCQVRGHIECFTYWDMMDLTKKG